MPDEAGQNLLPHAEPPAWSGRPSLWAQGPWVIVSVAVAVAAWWVWGQVDTWNTPTYSKYMEDRVAFGTLKTAVGWSLIGLCALVIAMTAYRMLHTVTTSYRLMGDRLDVCTGIFMRTSDVLQLYRVRDLQLRRSLLDRCVGCGTIVLVTVDATCPLLPLLHVRRSREVMSVIRASVEEARMGAGIVGII